MMRPRLSAFVLLAVLPILFSGCFGSVDAVYVPDSAVRDGWSHTSENQTMEAAGGTVEIVTNRYEYSGQVMGEVYLIGATDVPGVDEGDEIRDQIRTHADGQGVTLQETGTREVTLDNGKRVTATEYSITKQVATGTVRGQAWLLHWDAGGFSAGGLGWATTEHSTLLGTQGDPVAWEDAKTMLRAAAW